MKIEVIGCNALTEEKHFRVVMDTKSAKNSYKWLAAVLNIMDSLSEIRQYKFIINLITKKTTQTIELYSGFMIVVPTQHDLYLAPPLIVSLEQSEYQPPRKLKLFYKKYSWDSFEENYRTKALGVKGALNESQINGCKQCEARNEKTENIWLHKSRKFYIEELNAYFIANEIGYFPYVTNSNDPEFDRVKIGNVRNYVKFHNKLEDKKNNTGELIWLKLMKITDFIDDLGGENLFFIFTNDFVFCPEEFQNVHLGNYTDALKKAYKIRVENLRTLKTLHDKELESTFFATDKLEHVHVPLSNQGFVVGTIFINDYEIGIIHGDSEGIEFMMSAKIDLEGFREFVKANQESPIMDWAPHMEQLSQIVWCFIITNEEFCLTF
jgi:hypothetical protein